MQINRLFEIVYILLEKKTVTANELAAHFEVSKRTILRDVETLSMAGIPVYTTKGKGGGISILERFVLNKTTLSDQEQDQILLALQSLASTRQVDTDDVLSKLGALFQKADASWIEVDFSRWGNMAPDTKKFEQLKRAVLQKLPVSFVYPSSYGQTTRRSAVPLKLVFKAGAWYVQAYCLSKNSYRTFKISRMLQVEVLEGSFADRSFSPPPLETSEPPRPDSLVSLNLLFSPETAYRIYDEFDEKNVQKNPDGSFTVMVELPNDGWLYGFLLSFGAGVRVIAPEAVKTLLLQQAQTIQNMYAEDIK